MKAATWQVGKVGNDGKLEIKTDGHEKTWVEELQRERSRRLDLDEKLKSLWIWMRSWIWMRRFGYSTVEKFLGDPWGRQPRKTSS